MNQRCQYKGESQIQEVLAVIIGNELSNPAVDRANGRHVGEIVW
jgi:hypothetical protein